MQKQHQTQNSNEESKAIKRSVIAMYSSVDDEADTNELNENSSKPQHHQTVDSALEMFENTNAKNVSEVEKNTRLKQKEESAKKKEQDKINLEKQKVKKAERKEKEKQRTQKKERGR
uniref:Uncharacterized protein n=1 Tax=Ciona savignyi TaxID=51511 RepID=H2YX98_CIOSA